MEYIFWLWFIARLDDIKGWLGGNMLVLLTMATIISVGAYVLDRATIEDSRSKGKNREPIVRVWVPIALASLVMLINTINVIIPTQKQAMFIVGGIGVIEAAKTDTAQRIASKSVIAVEKFIDDLNARNGAAESKKDSVSTR